MQNNELHPRSKARNRKVRDFFYHLVVYLFVLAILFVVCGVSGALPSRCTGFMRFWARRVVDEMTLKKRKAA
jgi:hypothetical protein